MLLTHPNELYDLAETAYQSYARACYGQTEDGAKLPHWPELPDATRWAWAAAVQTLLPHTLPPLLVLLRRGGGQIIRSRGLAAAELTEARHTGRLWCDPDGYGYVYQNPMPVAAPEK